MSSKSNTLTKIANRIKRFLSRRAILYGFITGIGIVLFWRGVWHTNDMLMHVYTTWIPSVGPDMQEVIWWDGPLSFVIGSIMLLISGTFVSEFIGKEIIISGLTGEKDITEKTEKEIREEINATDELLDEVKALRADLKSKKNI